MKKVSKTGNEVPFKKGRKYTLEEMQIISNARNADEAIAMMAEKFPERPSGGVRQKYFDLKKVRDERRAANKVNIDKNTDTYGGKKIIVVEEQGFRFEIHVSKILDDM